MKTEGTGYSYGGGFGGDVKVPPRRAFAQKKWTPPPSPTRIRERSDEELAVGREMIAEAAKKRKRRHPTGRTGAPVVDEARIQAMIADYQGGMKARDAAIKNNMSPTTGLKYLRLREIPIRGSKRVTGLPDSIVTDYKRGMSLRDIAAKHDSSPPTVRKHLQAKGVEIRNKGAWRKFA